MSPFRSGGQLKDVHMTSELRATEIGSICSIGSYQRPRTGSPIRLRQLVRFFLDIDLFYGVIMLLYSDLHYTLPHMEGAIELSTLLGSHNF